MADMKVLLINGSPRKQGNTNTALLEISRELSVHGIESEMVWIGTGHIHGCIACGKCKEKSEGRCIFNDDITNEVISKMAHCDALVVGSPVYYGQPSGQLLCLQQRMLFAGGKNFTAKPVAAVAVCRRGGATAAYQTMLMPFQMMNMSVVTSQYWNLAYGRNEGEAAQDAEGMQTMRTMARNMAWLLKKIHGLETLPMPEHEVWTPMNFIR